MTASLSIVFSVVSYKDISYYGPPEYQCPHCKASFWFEERANPYSSWVLRKIVYNLCCKGGKVVVKPFRNPPALLSRLLSCHGDRVSKQFLTKIRHHSWTFAFTSIVATSFVRWKARGG